MLRMRSSKCKCARPMGHEISPRHMSQKADCAAPGESEWPMGVECIFESSSDSAQRGSRVRTGCIHVIEVTCFVNPLFRISFGGASLTRAAALVSFWELTQVLICMRRP